MKNLAFSITLILSTIEPALSQAPGTYTNFIRQIQYPTLVQRDSSVASNGEQLSALAIDPGGARFQLWTVESATLKEWLLESRYVGSYVPLANVVIRSEDMGGSIISTRADRPFFVDIVVSGLRSGATDPEASKSVRFTRHVQSYGATGSGISLDRTQATLLSQASITQNGTHVLTYTLTSVPGANRAKVRGEERFSVFSLKDYQAPESLLTSKFIQIWPVADGAISGIANNALVRFTVPTVTLTLNDLYPRSKTYAQVYEGSPRLGVKGTVVPGSALIINHATPQARVLVLDEWDSVLVKDGLWTMELLTSTPFGLDRLAFISFTLDRTIETNTSFTTFE